MLNAALFAVLLWHRRFRTVPWFTAWLGFGCVYTISLFLAYRLGTKHVYATLYWVGAFIDLLLQISVVLEIAAIVLRRSGRWVEGARIRLGLMGATAPLVALGMAWWMKPAAETALDAWEARGSLFTTVLVFLLFVAVVVASHQLGLGWSSYAMRESYGLVVWVVVAFLTDTLHVYWRTLGHFTLLEDVRIAVFQLASLYWIIAFWLPESVPAPITSENLNRLASVRRQLECGQQPSVAASTDGVVQK